MAKTSLRAYNHEIEEMIEHNQFDQAIAHCRNILKYYPKHINTYRLIGKAFLESQRYGDAGDIFQRILSSFPEDFISHVGMSIIREDEGNLDDSLWHMERAFEIQPSNNAIQGELRRLHGKLEGTEPAKIRLTRGALAHMYIRGDLLSQAIAELRIALTEDPSRFDLQTVLAKAYHQSGQLVEAAKISNSIIGKLPYSFEANRVLNDIYKKSDRLQEAQTYQQRLDELDPYFAHLSDTTPTPEQVSDSIVTLDRLDWKPGFSPTEVATQPEWAKSIGVSVESPITKDESVPDWFSTSEEKSVNPNQSTSPIIDIKEEESQAPLAWQAPEPVADKVGEDWKSPVEPDQIADDSFLQNAEYIQEEIQVSSEKVNTLEKSTVAGAEELAPAEIPDWLRALAPKTGNLEGKLPDLSAIPSEPQKENEYSWLDENPIEQEEKWSEPEEEAETPFALPGAENIDLPNWLHQGEEPATPEAKPIEPIQGLGQFKPQSGDVFSSDTIKEETDEFSWLSEDTAEQIPEETSQKESTSWSDETETEQIPLASAGEELPAAVEVELPEWLAQMKQDAEQNPELVKPAEIIPDWIKNIEPPVSEEDTKPTRLSKQVAVQEPTSFISEQIPEAATFSMPEIKENEEIPLSSIFEDKDFEFKDEEQEIDDSTITKTDEGEGQIGWLTDLEAQQQFEQGIFKEEKAEMPPDWVTESIEEAVIPSAVQEKPATLEEVQLPEWLAEIAPKTEEEVETGAEAKPDWLSEYESKPSQVEAFAEPISSDSTVFTIPETPLEEETTEEVETYSSQEFAEPGIFEEIEQPKEEEVLPEWLLEYKEEAPAEAVAEPISEQQPISEVPAWFEQPEQISRLDITFEEDALTEKPLNDEEQLFIEETPPVSVEIEPTTEFEALAEIPVFEAPEDEIPFTETIISEAPLEELPFAEAPVAEIPVEEIPFSESPISEFPVEELPVTEIPAEEIQITEAPVEEEVSFAEEPVSEAPVEVEVPFAEEPVSEASVEVEMPFAEEPVSEAPVEVEVPFAEEPLSEALIEELPVTPAPDKEIPIKKAPVTRILSEEVPATETPIETQIVLIDLNHASLVELERVPGIGFIKAQSIINFRDEHGAYASVDDLVDVPGFDEALVDAIKTRLEVIAPLEVPIQTSADAEIQTPLLKARIVLQQGKIPEAVSQYSELINTNADLDDIAFDLQTAIDQYPTDTDLWQTLGDTCVRLGKLQDALNAYTQAEKLLR